MALLPWVTILNEALQATHGCPLLASRLAYENCLCHASELNLVGLLGLGFGKILLSQRNF